MQHGFFRREELEELKQLVNQKEEMDGVFPENEYILSGEDADAEVGQGATKAMTTCAEDLDDGHYEEPIVDHIYEEPNGAPHYIGGPTSVSSISSLNSPGACADERFLLK